MNSLRQILCLGVLLFLAVSELRADSPAQPPGGLSSSEWSGLRAAYNAGRHRIIAGEDGHQARNPGQQWRTRFDGQGFVVQPDGADWQWGLELIAYGFPGQEHTLPTGNSATRADVEGTLLTYAWDAGLSEWFVNDARGLEHGFTVHERPEIREVLDCGSPLPLSETEERPQQWTSAEPKRQRTGAVQDAAATTAPLNFRLTVRGDLHPVIEPDGRGVRFVDTHGTTRTTYAGLKVWDADGRILPASFAPLDPQHPSIVTLTVDEHGARYPLTIDPIAQQAYLKAFNTDPNDHFGWSVAVTGDTVVVGAPYEDSSATGINGDANSNSNIGDSGAAYVFVRSGGNWTQQAYLKASNTRGNDNFGYSVAVADDTVVVGAPYESSDAKGVNGDSVNSGAPNSGAAYVFVRQAGIWTQQAYLKASNTQGGDNFGYSVAVAGDTAVVGAIAEASNSTGINGNGGNNSAVNAGAAYVFIRSGDAWSQQAYLKASNTGAGDHFGFSVGVSGDTVVVGAPNEDSSTIGVNGDGGDNSAVGSGAAYVFGRNGGAWVQQAFVKASNTKTAAYFGWSVSASDDTVAVGAPLDSGAPSPGGDGISGSGAVYVFVYVGETWTQRAYLKASNVGAGDQFGVSVAVSGDRLVAGSIGEDSGATGVNGNQSDNAVSAAGAAYLFVRNSGRWTQRAYFKASNTGASDYFGNSVAVSGDTVAVGAPQEGSRTTGINGDGSNNSARNSGAAYVFLSDAPHIVVEQAAGVGLIDGSSNVKFGTVTVGGNTDLIFTIRNSGTTNLTDLALTLDGPNANQFSVTANPAASVAPGESTPVGVRFSPTSDGTKTATLHIASNDPDHNPFDLALLGTPNVATIATSGSDLTVSFVGEPGNRYRVQYTLDASTSVLWNEFTPPALYTVPADGVFHHTDVNPTDILRLYRAVPQP